MKRLISFAVLFMITVLSFGQTTAKSITKADNSVTDNRVRVVLKTSMGDITIALADETPDYRDNFVRLVKKKYYDGVLFHRVIKDFMIQTGDHSSIKAKAGQMLGGGADEGKTLPAEIVWPGLYHKYGAVAAAREGDEVNPDHRSSNSQFYIVTGEKRDDGSMEFYSQYLDSTSLHTLKYTPEQIATYKKIGGTPHLDAQYTVFGEVINGMDVVEKIQSVLVDGNNRPVEDVRIISANIIKQ